MKAIRHIVAARILLASCLGAVSRFAVFIQRWHRPDMASAAELPGWPPTTSSLRKLLKLVLIGDSDLDAFCLDHFPDVQQRFTHGMDRTHKLNILLVQASRIAILRRLCEDYPQQTVRYHHFIRYEGRPGICDEET